ncbi:extracellular matrix regulator RemB [Guptibacillus algicola]|uniref:extracellular matrix regulator RemB n=1 Tax=Guptibacillus algicola TaxID=225844 RepID=UPI001CD1B22A|nr:extracellular matrix/biofilm biosynthesis regulator RemA family protein [Alkalihalobacillus algicola]MCA0988760.1 DUF370 domain-containing protein [Alkalihalobacillus algicola]
MFIHLGEDVVVQSRDVVGIFDWHVMEEAEITTEFLHRHSKDKLVEDIGGDLTKSIVITTDMVFLSPLSSLTLKRRAYTVSDSVETTIRGESS